MEQSETLLRLCVRYANHGPNDNQPDAWNDIESFVASLRAEAVAAVRAELLEVAHATGIVLEPEGHAVQPGPTKLIVDEIKRTAERRKRLQEIVDEWRSWAEALVGIGTGGRDSLQERIGAIAREHGELQVRLQNLIDQNMGYRETTPLAGLVGILERELPSALSDDESATPKPDGAR